MYIYTYIHVYIYMHPMTLNNLTKIMLFFRTSRSRRSQWTQTQCPSTKEREGAFVQRVRPTNEPHHLSPKRMMGNRLGGLTSWHHTRIIWAPFPDQSHTSNTATPSNWPEKSLELSGPAGRQQRNRAG